MSKKSPIHKYRVRVRMSIADTTLVDVFARNTQHAIDQAIQKVKHESDAKPLKWSETNQYSYTAESITFLPEDAYDYHSPTAELT